MKRPLDPDDRSAKARASLQSQAAYPAPPKPKPVPLPPQVPKPQPVDPVPARSSKLGSALVRNVQLGQSSAPGPASLQSSPKHAVPAQGLALLASPKHRASAIAEDTHS